MFVHKSKVIDSEKYIMKIILCFCAIVCTSQPYMVSRFWGGIGIPNFKPFINALYNEGCLTHGK